MASLYFIYGTMSSSKSMRLLAVNHNYIENGMKTLLLTSALDNRDGVGIVSSRAGLTSEATAIDETDNLFALFSSIDDSVDAILVDESQFLTRTQVLELSKIVDNYNIPVMCYGLKTDFQGVLFEGSRALLEIADKLEEVKTLCRFCRKKSIMNMRVDENGHKLLEGETVQIGGNESYLPVCRKHFFGPPNGSVSGGRNAESK